MGIGRAIAISTNLKFRPQFRGSHKDGRDGGGVIAGGKERKREGAGVGRVAQCRAVSIKAGKRIEQCAGQRDE